MNTSPVASGPRFRICPLCEESRLVFSGLNDARCPVCEHEPGDGFLLTLRQIVNLPEIPERELRVRKPDSKKNDEREGGDTGDCRESLSE